MLQEQVKWAVEGGCDYIIAETFGYLGEALLALEVIKEHAKGIIRLHLGFFFVTGLDLGLLFIYSGYVSCIRNNTALFGSSY